eukprot:2179265-Prymnesium_polylepis.1
MPLESTPEAHKLLETWGNDSLNWLVANVLTHLNAEVLKAEALRTRLFVCEHKSQWMLEHKVVGENGKVMGSERRLTLTGEESIAHTLFSEPGRISGGVPSQFLELLDFMISFRFTQCDTERLGRTMTLTKPALRSSLGDLPFKQVCWVAFTSPGFHDARGRHPGICPTLEGGRPPLCGDERRRRCARKRGDRAQGARAQAQLSCCGSAMTLAHACMCDMKLAKPM